jgi:hypothetical protein
MLAANMGLWMFSNWNHLYGFAADRAHHIIIGILLPKLESDMKQVRGFAPTGLAHKNIKPGVKSPGLMSFPEF